MTAFLRFGLDTFDGTEQGSSSDTPALFNPSNLDATQLQPNIVVEAGPELARQGAAENPPGYPDVQWIGNESGQSTRTASSLDDENCGGNNRWCPNEADTSARGSSTWFWHSGQSPLSVGEMESIFFNTVSMNATLNYNVPPAQTGQFDPADVTVLQQFGTWYSSTFKTNFAKQQPATADSTWATAGFEAGKAVDDDVCTYWAAASGKTSGTTANLISAREAIELGERVTKYHVEVQQNGTRIQRRPTSPETRSRAP